MQKLDLKFDTNVYAFDKHCGQLAKLVVDPKSWQITDLILEDGLIFKRTAVVPITKVIDTLGQVIHLNIEQEQLKDFPEFRETVVEKGAPGWQAAKTIGEIEYMGLPSTHVPNMTTVREKTRIGVNSNAFVLDSHTELYHLDGHLGYLSRIIIGSNDFLPSELVFSQGTLLPTYRTIPIRYVDRLNESGIQLMLTKEEAAQQPEYIPANPAR